MDGRSEYWSDFIFLRQKKNYSVDPMGQKNNKIKTKSDVVPTDIQAHGKISGGENMSRKKSTKIRKKKPIVPSERLDHFFTLSIH